MDDDTFIALEHAGGTRSHLWCSSVARDLGPRFRVLGSSGAYVKYGLDPQEDALEAGGDPSAPGWGRDESARWGTLAVGGTEARIETEPGGYPEYYAGIAKALREGAPPPVDPRDSVTGLRVLEAAARSAATGSAEAFAPI